MNLCINFFLLWCGLHLLSLLEKLSLLASELVNLRFLVQDDLVGRVKIQSGLFLDLLLSLLDLVELFLLLLELGDGLFGGNLLGGDLLLAVLNDGILGHLDFLLHFGCLLLSSLVDLLLLLGHLLCLLDLNLLFREGLGLSIELLVIAIDLGLHLDDLLCDLLLLLSFSGLKVPLHLCDLRFLHSVLLVLLGFSLVVVSKASRVGSCH